MGKTKKQMISLPLQMLKLKATYGKLLNIITISRTHNQLYAIIRLQPTEESIEYTVKIIYKIGRYPEAWLLEPKNLASVNNKFPHHVYGKDKNGFSKLCVFYPKNHEWNDSMFLATTFIPWVVTWLSAYEYWQISGIWIYPESSDLKKDE